VAELQLKVGDGPGGEDISYQDGDVVNAFSDRRILLTHARSICHPRNSGFNQHGLRAPDSLLDLYLDMTSRYLFTRVGRHAVIRSDRVLLQVDELNQTPNANGQYIHVEEYVKRRTRHHTHSIFGVVGGEHWYGGPITPDRALVDEVWSAIETHSVFRKADNDKWPITERERKIFLSVTVDDFGLDMESRLPGVELEAPAVDSPLSYKRRTKVDWRALGLFNERAVDDRSMEVDFRGDTLLLSDIVIYKPRKTVWTDEQRREFRGDNN